MPKAIVEKITEGLGWIGVLLILCAYILLSFGFLHSESFWYQGLNLMGGLAIVVDAIADKNYQTAFLNFIWAFIALVSMLRIVV